MLTGLFYNLGIWVDKFIFWLHPVTGSTVIGPLRASLVYDLPVFLAYLAIIPGMAVFLVRMETDFVEYGSTMRFVKARSLSYIQGIRGRDGTGGTGRAPTISSKFQAIAYDLVIVAGKQLLMGRHLGDSSALL